MALFCLVEHLVRNHLDSLPRCDYSDSVPISHPPSLAAGATVSRKTTESFIIAQTNKGAAFEDNFKVYSVRKKNHAEEFKTLTIFNATTRTDAYPNTVYEVDLNQT